MMPRDLGSTGLLSLHMRTESSEQKLIQRKALRSASARVQMYIAAVVLATLSMAAWTATDASAECGNYKRYRWVTLTNSPALCTDPGGVICESGNSFCNTCSFGCAYPGCVCNCDTMVKVYEDIYSCETGEIVRTDLLNIGACPCTSAGQAYLAAHLDGAMVPNSYSCTENCVSTTEPEQCDGLDAGDTTPLTTDEGCGDDEYMCSAGNNDRDGAPVRFSSGRVESNPITLFQLPTPDGLFFGYRILWNSHVTRNAAQALVVHNTQDPEPTIHHSDETTHFIGNGWLDDYSDRLFVNVRNQSTDKITWQRRDATITFSSASGWKSAGGKFELIDRGPNPAQRTPTGDDGYGRWVVRTTDSHARREIWAFEEHTYVDYGSATTTYTLGRLRRRALLTSSLTDLNGRYGFTISWTPSGTLEKAVDSIGRELRFFYVPVTDPSNSNIIRSRRLSYVQYRPSATASIWNVVRLSMTQDKTRLDKVEQIGTSKYTRFLYMQSPPSGCPNCTSLVVAVIGPGTGPGSTPAIQAPLQIGEVALEENWYGQSLASSRYIGIRSRYPGREYAHEYGINLATQFDLHQPGSTNCSPGSCPQGMACRISDTTCYVADIMQHNAASRLPTSRVSAGGGGGNRASFGRTYAPSGAPKSSTDAAGTQTTFGFDSAARVRCIVRGDTDQEAFAIPSQPDTSPCAGPTTAQIIRVDYNGSCTDGYVNCVKKTTSSVLSGNVIEEEDFDPMTLLPVRTKTTGMTRDIDGVTVSQSQSRVTTYDSYGRAIEVNGPLIDSVALDRTTTSYHSYNASEPFNVGHVHQVTQYVGTSSSSTALVTTYSEYDINGVARRVTGPGGDYIYLTTSDRLTWTIQHKLGTTVIASSIVTLNLDGRVRKAIDPDNLCLTYEYSDTSGYVGAPTRIKRSLSSDAACGTVPIDPDSGEVEIRAYFNGESDRLKSITRKMHGLTHFEYAFNLSNYDRDRRLITAPTVHSATPFTLNYTDVLQTGITAPGAPGPGTWRTDTIVDDFGRPTSLQRFVDGSNKLVHNFSYASPLSPRPSQLTRGYNGAQTSVTTFVYDDFGRLLESVVPEAGAPGGPVPTRYEYDVAGRMTKRRIGVGTALVRTSAYTYDSLDRTLAVDHDTEHPVNCTFAPVGVTLQDEEYKYDTCTGDAPAGFTCANALGRLTMARAALHCNGFGETVKRGRWYTYSSSGFVEQVAYAAVTGTWVQTPAIITYSRGPGGRISEQSSPLNAAFGTRYEFGSNGNPNLLSRGDSTALADGISYRSFGPLNRLKTRSLTWLQPLEYTATFATDDSLAEQRWYSPGWWGAIELMRQAISRTSSGLISARSDSGDQVASRYYGYDSLLRMTCEARGDSTSPTSADCTTNSTRLAGLFTYGNGDPSKSPPEPPDVRLSAFLRSESNNATSKYVSGSVETLSYASGSGQVLGVTRTGSSLVIGYDALGRRSFEYDSASPTTSRRDYYYLPNGQLGTIVTRDRDNPSTQLQMSMRYDEQGRPLTMAQYRNGFVVEDAYELFWDDSSRLAAAQIAFPASRNCGGTINCTGVRWHYHYLGERLIAATRELVGVAGGSEKIFWAITDERGLVHRLVDTDGATYWQARWDASGWGTWVGTPQPEMWVPFGLPGQVVLGAVRRSTGTAWGTEAANASGASATARPPISLNQWRAYDPFVGSFLQPDPADSTGRLSPEGYVLARSNPLYFEDRTGANSSVRESLRIELGWWTDLLNGPYLLDSGCEDTQKFLNGAIALAYLAVSTCVGKGCSIGDIHRREWMATIANSLYSCPIGKFTNSDGDQLRVYADNAPQSPTKYSNIFGGDAPPSGIPAFSDDGRMTSTGRLWQVFLSRRALRATSLGCLAFVVAHEAGHGVLSDSSFAPRHLGSVNPDYDAQEAYLTKQVKKCFVSECPLGLAQ